MINKETVDNAGLSEEFLNVLAFLFIMFNEDCEHILRLSPDYITEKFGRYCGTGKAGDHYQWGMHPSLERWFEEYIHKWGLKEYQ